VCGAIKLSIIKRVCHQPSSALFFVVSKDSKEVVDGSTHWPPFL